MEDGSAPSKAAVIQRYCGAERVMVEALTNSRGEYVLRGSDYETVGNWGSRQLGSFGTMKCFLRAILPGYESSMIDLDDPRLFASPDLPALILRRKGSQPKPAINTALRAPSIAQRMWERAAKAMSAGRWAEAERELRLAVTASPDFAAGWNALGLACQNQNKAQEARDAYLKAIAADPKDPNFDLLLLRLEAASKNWQAAANVASALIAKDPGQRHPEAYLHRAIAQYHLRDLDNAARSAAEAVRLDRNHQIPNAEYIYGLILEARQEFPAAEEHYRRYLEIDPKAEIAQTVRRRMANLGKGAFGIELPELNDVAVNVRAVRAVWVPGGRKTLAAVAHLDGDASPSTYFAEYCRALVRATDRYGTSAVPGFHATLRAYFAAMPELAALGDQRERGSTLTLSLAADRSQAERVLQLLGWRQVPKSAPPRLELADSLMDGPRHPIAAALDIDEVALQQALEAGRSFSFEVPSEEAPLMGGDSWLELVHDRQMMPGGLAEAFARDMRLAKAYFGLSAAGTEASDVLVSALGLKVLVERHAEALYRHGSALRVQAGVVQVPGGAAAEPAWVALTGANPRNPAAFLPALLARDQGRLAAFYGAVSSLDQAHAGFFTSSTTRLQSVYSAYPGSRDKAAQPAAVWQPGDLARVPLQSDGQVRWPGGPGAWEVTPETVDQALARPGTVPQLLALAALETGRHAPLDAASVALLRRNFIDWQALLPCFAAMPALGPPEFQALERFTTFARSHPAGGLNVLLGQWYSLVDLVSSAVRAHALDDAAAAGWFRRICDTLAAKDHSPKAMELMRALIGGGDLDQGVRHKLLRLSGARRVAFDRVAAAQAVPALQTAERLKDDQTVLPALAGLSYAAYLSPDALLVSEDAKLLSKHRFAPLAGAPVFTAAVLEKSTKAPGSRFAGGFIAFDELARRLPAAGPIAAPSTAEVRAGPSGGGSFVGAPPEAALEGQVFRADARLVEVYATVTDSRGRYADELPASEFTVLEDGKPRKVVSFESRLAGVSCALLLDSTLSMQASLPALKNAALELIAQLRGADALSVYTFNDAVTGHGAPALDKTPGRRAVVRARAQGETALYDALIRVIRDMAALQGKKAIVVFTDGDDNSSSLGSANVIRRAKAAGIPIYTIAQGMALADPTLPRLLAGISTGTGGLPFTIREPKEIQQVFDAVAKDLAHGYLLTIAPGSDGNPTWRKLEVQVPRRAGYKVRSREGYYPE